MAATPLFTCTCGVQKKTSNHWILAITSAHDVRFMPWDANLAMEDHVIVLCGERFVLPLCSAGASATGRPLSTPHRRAWPLSGRSARLSPLLFLASVPLSSVQTAERMHGIAPGFSSETTVTIIRSWHEAKF